MEGERKSSNTSSLTNYLGDFNGVADEAAPSLLRFKSLLGTCKALSAKPNTAKISCTHRQYFLGT
jgi:hypothetical protein